MKLVKRDDGGGWVVRGVIRDKPTGAIKEALNIPAPGKEHYFEQKYLQRCEEAAWDEFHVLPLEDKEEHEVSRDCPCGGEVEEHEESITVFHKAFDGREPIGWIEDLFKS